FTKFAIIAPRSLHVTWIIPRRYYSVKSDRLLVSSIRTITVLWLVTVTGGCASNLPLRHVPSDKNSMFITDASAVLTLTRSRNPDLVTCSRMNADVSVSRTASLSVSALNFGDDAEDVGEDETELQGRTPGLLAMRDALFHSCMLYQSGVITSADLLQMTQSILAKSYDVLEIEARNSQWIYNEQPAPTVATTLVTKPATTAASSSSTSTTESSDASDVKDDSDDFADYK
ncbi:hypothetical protein, partial [Chromatocurvus halotolerans]